MLPTSWPWQQISVSLPKVPSIHPFWDSRARATAGRANEPELPGRSNLGYVSRDSFGCSRYPWAGPRAAGPVGLGREMPRELKVNWDAHHPGSGQGMRNPGRHNVREDPAWFNIVPSKRVRAVGYRRYVAVREISSKSMEYFISTQHWFDAPPDCLNRRSCRAIWDAGRAEWRIQRDLRPI